MESSQTRDRTCVLYIGRWILKHWTHGVDFKSHLCQEHQKATTGSLSRGQLDVDVDRWMEDSHPSK